MSVLSARENLKALSNNKGGLFVNDFVPSTGIGKFDARYDVAANELHITLKVFYVFRNLGGRADWEIHDQVEYKRKLKDVIESTWSECYTIASDKSELRDMYARVYVHIEEVPTLGGAHYTLQISNFLRGETSGAGIARNEMTGMFGAFDIIPETKKNRDQGALAFKMQQVAEQLDTSGAAYLPFPANSSEISTDALLKLRNFGSQARRVITKEMAESEFAIYVYGKTGTADTATNLWTAKNRAKKVADILRGHLGFKKAVTVVSSAGKEPWISGANGPVSQIMSANGFSQQEITARSFPGAMLLMKDPGSIGQNLEVGLPRNYIVVAHEVGHMFGLPDEYFGVNCLALQEQVDLRTMVPAAVHNLTRLQADPREPGQAEGFAALVKESNVPSPVFMSSRSLVTTSLMYAGSDVLPAHYLTFWEALLNCTFPYFLPSDWKIVPNKAGEGKKSNIAFFAQ